MGLFSRKPELQDQALSELGQMFSSPELVVDDPTPGSELPLAETDAEDLDPIAAIQSFYPMVEALARARGLDPDAPRHLAKVTLTQ